MSAQHLVSSGVRALLGRLVAYWVDWNFPFVPAENVAYEPGIDRRVESLEEANVVSSALKPILPQTWTDKPPPRHAVLLDIDYEAFVVPSSTPGHNHLYLCPPGGVAHDDYMELLALLGRIGVIEKGYAEVSIKRGHSDLRLPWVTKDDQVLHQEDPKAKVTITPPSAAAFEQLLDEERSMPTWPAMPAGEALPTWKTDF